jgi:hypothetical protein
MGLGRHARIGDEMDVCFYTNEIGEVEMVTEREAIVYNGPRWMVKDYDDVLLSRALRKSAAARPVKSRRCALCGPAGFSDRQRNRKSPEEQILRFADEGRTGKAEDQHRTRTSKARKREAERRAFRRRNSPAAAGFQPQKADAPDVLRPYDIDGDGIAEDCVFWVIKETKTTPAFAGCPMSAPARRRGARCSAAASFLSAGA